MPKETARGLRATVAGTDRSVLALMAWGPEHVRGTPGSSLRTATGLPPGLAPSAPPQRPSLAWPLQQ